MPALCRVVFILVERDLEGCHFDRNGLLKSAALGRYVDEELADLRHKTRHRSRFVQIISALAKHM